MSLAASVDYRIFEVLFVGCTIWFSLVRIWIIRGYSPDGVITTAQVLGAAVKSAAKAFFVSSLTALSLYLLFVLTLRILP